MTNIKNCVKIFLINFLIAISLSFSLFHLYLSNSFKEKIDALSIKEQNTIRRCGVVNEKFRFCVYPEGNHNSQITWDKNENHSLNSNSLRVNFKDDNTKSYVGIHLYLTLNLNPYLDKGVLEFWLKGGKNYSLVKNLGIYLKEGPIIERIIGVSLSPMVNKNWQRLSVPLSKFSLVKGENKYADDKEFTWGIQEVLFSIGTISYKESVELFIDDLRVMHDGKVIYELF